MNDLWIRVDADLGENEKVRRLARALFHSAGDSGGGSAQTPHWIAVPATEGLLQNLWGKLARYQEDGRIADRDDDQLEEWAKWHGEPGRFARYFRELMVTDGAVTDWQEYQGKLIEHRAKERQRWQRRKKAQDSAPTPPEPPPEAPPEPPPLDGNGNGTTLPTPSSAGDAPPIAGAVVGPIAQLAIALTATANRAIAERWGEQVNVLMHTAPPSHEAAERVLEAGVDVELARSSIAAQCARSKRARPPGTLTYFVPGILEDAERAVAREQARASPDPAPLPERANSSPRRDTRKLTIGERVFLKASGGHLP